MFPAYAHLSAYDRHKKLINDYLTLRGGSIKSFQRDTSRDKTDYDVIRENHKFLWDEDNDLPETWGAKLAKKYYDKLFKEYCICDLTYFKYNKFALRWRTEKEVIVGKGQFQCGSKGCNIQEELRTWEVNFGYIENNEKKNALVKLRLCPECSQKLNYKSQKREIKRRKSLKRLKATETIPSTSTTGVSESESVIKETEIKGSDGTERVLGSDEKEQPKLDDNRVWKEKPSEGIEKPREEEFEEYLADLFA